MNVLALCSGIGGGIELGLKLAEPTARTVCYVEREAFPIAVTLTRIREGYLDDAPIWSDVTTFDGKPWRNVVDCITGGYPCQPFSVAGQRQGEHDPRHLWPDIKRIVGEVRPRFCFFENVAGHLQLGFESVWRDLSDMGYEVEAGLFTAAEVGAPHKRQRLFILAHADAGRRWSQGHGQQLASGPDRGNVELGDTDGGHGARGPEPDDGRAGGAGLPDPAVADTGRAERRQDNGAGGHSQQGGYGEGEATSRAGKRSQAMAHTSNQRHQRSGDARHRGDGPADHGKLLGDTDGSGSQGRGESEREGADEFPAWPPSPTNSDAWAAILEQDPGLEPAIRRVADGIPNRLDRLAALGNAVVPAVAATAWRQLRKEADGFTVK